MLKMWSVGEAGVGQSRPARNQGEAAVPQFRFNCCNNSADGWPSGFTPMDC